MKGCPFKVGDLVGYKVQLGDPDFSVVGHVYEVWDQGIPSNPRPLIKIEGKAGVIDPGHCTRLPKLKFPSHRLLDALGALCNPDDQIIGINPGPEADELQAAYDEWRADEAKIP